MKLRLLGILVLLVHGLLFRTFANNDQRVYDSLVTQLEFINEDSNKVNALLDLAQLSKKLNYPNDVTSYNVEALILAKRINFKNGEFIALFNLGKIYRKQGDFDESKKYLLQAKNLVDQVNFENNLIKINQELAKVYRAQGEYKESVVLLLQNFKIQEQLGDKEQMMGSLIELGIVNREQGYFLRSIEYINDAILIGEDDVSETHYARAKIEKGRTLREKGDYDEALTYLEEAKELVFNGDNSGFQGYVVDEMGKVYLSKQNYQEALKLFTQSKEIGESVDDKFSLGYTYLNLAKVNQHLGNNAVAQDYCEKSLAIRREVKDHKGMVTTLNMLSDLYLKLGGSEHEMNSNLEKALALKTEALSMAQETGSKSLLIETYHGLSIVYAKLEEYKKSLHYLELYSIYKDSIHNDENSKKIAELQGVFEEEKKDKEIGVLKREKDLVEKEARTQQILLWTAGIVLCVIALLSFVMFKQVQAKKKANKLLAETNLELEKLSIVASETNNAVIIADSKGNLEWANKAFGKLSGYTLEEYKQEKGNNIIESIDDETAASQIKHCLEHKSPVKFDLHKERNGGGLYWTHVDITPIIDEENNIKKLVIIETDITQEKLAQIKIEEKNEKISESITYARRIQNSLIPHIDEINTEFPSSFMFYKPKDIVSGDFPWMYKKGNTVYMAAVDCTGHGVPGAMISFIGHFLLNEINSHHDLLAPSIILDQLHAKLVDTLKQDSEYSENTRDGMDIALCKINTESMELEFSGAHRPLFLYKKATHEIEQIKGDKLAIGGKLHEILAKKEQRKGNTDFDASQIKFENLTFKINKGDAIFFGSDGLPDQFGGEKRMKYGNKKYAQIILDNIGIETMESIGELIEEDFYSWMNDYGQVDDVLLIGIKF